MLKLIRQLVFEIKRFKEEPIKLVMGHTEMAELMNELTAKQMISSLDNLTKFEGMEIELSDMPLVEVWGSEGTIAGEMLEMPPILEA